MCIYLTLEIGAESSKVSRRDMAICVRNLQETRTRNERERFTCRQGAAKAILGYAIAEAHETLLATLDDVKRTEV